MNTDKKTTIGTIIEGHAQRDAIHVAVAPVEAAEELTPGEPVELDEDGKAIQYNNVKLGVVDPFLNAPVEKGQKFWLFMYPNTVLNLRHEWDHPMFRVKASKSIEWLTEYAVVHRTTYNDLIAGVRKFIAEGCNYPVFEDNFYDFEVPAEFWTHFDAVTGLKGQGNFWGCCI